MTRVALLGLGGAAERIHLPGLQKMQDVQIVAGADPDPARRRWASTVGIPLTYDNPFEALQQTKADVAVIATPPDLHRDLAITALERGMHVFCEKPFVTSIKEADDVVDAVEATGLKLAVNNQYRQMLIYRKTRAALRHNMFGNPYLLTVWQQMNLPPSHDPAWRAALSKRVLFEFATHAMDLVTFLFGMHPVAVSARTPKVTEDQKADLICIVRLDLPDDRSATLVFNRRSEAPQKYIEMRLDCERASLRLSLGGLARAELGWNTERGRPRFRFSYLKGGEVRVERNGKSTVLARDAASPFAPATAVHFRTFLDSIKNDTRPDGSAVAARELLRTVFAAYESADNDGKLVRISRPAEAATIL